MLLKLDVFQFFFHRPPSNRPSRHRPPKAMESVLVGSTPCRSRIGRPIYNDLAMTPLKIQNPLPKSKVDQNDGGIVEQKGGATATATMSAENTIVPDTMMMSRTKRTYQPEQSLMDLIKSESKSRKLYPAAMHVQFQSCYGRNIKTRRSERELAHGWWW